MLVFDQKTYIPPDGWPLEIRLENAPGWVEWFDKLKDEDTALRYQVHYNRPKIGNASGH
jgi:hypothetical protein